MNLDSQQIRELMRFNPYQAAINSKKQKDKSGKEKKSKDLGIQQLQAVFTAS